MNKSHHLRRAPRFSGKLTLAPLHVNRVGDRFCASRSRRACASPLPEPSCTPDGALEQDSSRHNDLPPANRIPGLPHSNLIRIRIQLADLSSLTALLRLNWIGSARH